MKCLTCGSDVPPNFNSSLCPACLQAGEEKKFRVGVLIFGAIMALTILLVISLVSANPHSAPVPADTENQIPAAEPENTPSSPAAQSEKPGSNWDYSTVQMEAGTKTEIVGCIPSDQMVRLKWPYSNVYANLCFRSDRSVWLGLNGDGQILSGDNHGARIRIGAGTVRAYSLEEPTDYSSNIVFISPVAALFSAAKAGKQIAVQATYYDAGNQTLTFTPTDRLNFK